MSWIKRNLGFVISGGLGLVLLGLSGWYLYSETQASDAAQANFENAVKSLHDAQNMTPFPSEKNLELARQDLEKATNLAALAKGIFLPFKQYGGYSDRSFKNYLETQVFNMQQEAKQYGVTLPADYYFTFGGLRKVMSFDKELFPAWVEAMEEIKTLVDILIKARVNSIDSIRRSAFSDVEAGDYPQDFMNGVDSVTNLGVIHTPYDVTFSSFSGELASVIEGFMRSSNCFLLKNIQVAPGADIVEHFVDLGTPGIAPPVDIPPPPAAANQAPVMSPAERKRMEDIMFMRRYGMQRRTMPLVEPKPAPVPVTPVVPRVIPPPVTVLSERPLQVTIFIEILKLDTPPPVVKRAGSRGGRTSMPNNAAGAPGATNPAVPAAPAASANP